VCNLVIQEECMMNEKPALIDTDVHNAIGDLTPFLPKAWHALWKRANVGIGGFYSPPISVSRMDAVPDRGGAPGGDPEYMIKDHLDRYNIDYAILTGSNILAISLHPDPDYANEVVRACNEYM